MVSLKTSSIFYWLLQRHLFGKRVLLIVIFFFFLHFLTTRRRYHTEFEIENGELNEKQLQNEKLSNLDPTLKDLFDNPYIQQDDPVLLKYIKQNHLTPPPIVRNTSNIRETSEFAKEIWQIFRGRRHGFYIECGANNGEYLSNTFILDKMYDWSGLLIEANPYLLKDLYSNGRNGWISDACLSTKAYPQKLEFIHRLGTEEFFKGNGMLRGTGDRDSPTYPPETHNYVSAGLLDCFPLYSILAALGVTTVDYFSLDVEGIEYKILKNIPFDKVTIKVISVEFNVIPEGKPALLKLFSDNGYEVVIETYREIFAVLTRYRHEFGKRSRRRTV